MAKKLNAKRVQVKLPAGFTVTSVSGDFGEFVNWTKPGQTVQGKVLDVGKINGEYGTQRTITIQNGKVKSTVTESKGLASLFDVKGIKGKTVYIQFHGVKKVGKPRRDGSQKTFKQFTHGYK